MRGNSSLPFSLLVLLGLAGYFAYQIYTLKMPCVTPLTYSLVVYDDKFGLDKSTVETDIKNAAAVWNKALGKTVFEQGEKPDLPVEFVYGSLASEIDTLNSLNGRIDTAKDDLTSVANQYADLKKQYEAAQRQGTATEEMYQELQTLLARYYKLRSNINSDISSENHLPQGETTAGEYVSDDSGTKIYVFGFQSEKELESTLIHEFGHALGLGHVDDKVAVMYPTDVSISTTLAPADLAELARACGPAEHSFQAVVYGYSHKILEYGTKALHAFGRN